MTVDRLELTAHVARSIWERRRYFLKRMFDTELEEWGNGEIPRSNGIMGEAEAAILAYETEMKIAPAFQDEIGKHR